MISKTLQSRIDGLYKTIEDSQKELKSLRGIYSLFPDLKYYVGRWSNKYYTSEANRLVNDVTLHYGYECIFAEPYFTY